MPQKRNPTSSKKPTMKKVAAKPVKRWKPKPADIHRALAVAEASMVPRVEPIDICAYYTALIQAAQDRMTALGCGLIS